MSLDPVTAIADLAHAYIDNKDKAAEFDAKLQDLKIQFDTTLLQTKTWPWVDAITKLLFVAKEFFRPVAGTVLFFYGLSHPETLKIMHEQLGTMGDVGIAGIFGALPAWGYSRHVIESKKAENSLLPGSP